jgi:hypothetical protein
VESERIQSEGRLAVAQNEIRQLEITLGGLRKSLRAELDLFKPIPEIDGALVADMGLRFANLLIEHREKRDLIAALQKALGR